MSSRGCSGSPCCYARSRGLPPNQLPLLTRTMRSGEFDRVSSVRLDPFSWFAWDQRWSDHDALLLRRVQLPLDPITAGPGFITEPQPVTTASKLAHHPINKIDTLLPWHP